MNPLIVVGGGIWASFVFVTTFYLAFPSEVVANRLAHEVNERSRGEYQLEVDAVSPWWVGVSADNVVVSSRAPAAGFGEAAGPSHMPFFLADEVSLRVGLFSLFNTNRKLFGQVQMGEALIDAEASLAIDEGKASLRKLEAYADDVDVGEIMVLAGAADTVELAGSVDLDIDLDMAKGMEQASGDVSLTGSGVRINGVSYPAGSEPLEIDAPVDELDIRLRGDEGLFELTRGTLASSLADIDLEGEVRLGDRVARSRIELKAELELHDWTGTPLEAMRRFVEPQLARAKWSDDSYHYTVNTTLDRFDMGDFRPETERRSTTSYKPPVARPTTTTPPPDATPAAPPARPTPRRPEPEPMDEEILDEEEFEDEFEDEDGEELEEEDIEMEGY